MHLDLQVALASLRKQNQCQGWRSEFQTHCQSVAEGAESCKLWSAPDDDCQAPSHISASQKHRVPATPFASRDNQVPYIKVGKYRFKSQASEPQSPALTTCTGIVLPKCAKIGLLYG